MNAQEGKGEFRADLAGADALVTLFRARGIRRVVLSPGSRNAPLLLRVARERFFYYVIVDERTAAFFALGLAAQSGETVALICTSGTALLNYAPAVAEAYYRGISLIVISADRPPEWIDQDDGQTIRQLGALANVVKGSFQLPSDGVAEAVVPRVSQIINEAINLSRAGFPGPVHVNVPLREPLYLPLPSSAQPCRVIASPLASRRLPESEIVALAKHFAATRRVMIVAGFGAPDAELQALISRFAARANVVVLADTLANVAGGRVITAVDRLLAALTPEQRSALSPELLITFGGALVSRRLKEWLRETPPAAHWRADRKSLAPDAFRSLTLHAEMSPVEFLRPLDDALPEQIDSEYAERWQECRSIAAERHDARVRELPWCDLLAFSVLLPSLPAGCLLHLGNSTPVRYAQLFDNIPAGRIDGNRGTCGIEGATSTAAGAAMLADKPVVLVTGDLSFLYDQNALWNCPLSPHLRVVIILNGGGAIFRCIPGASAELDCEELFVAPHFTDIRAIVRAHHISVSEVSSAPALQKELPKFFAPQSRPSVLIIRTKEEPNGRILKQYFEYLISRP